MNFPDLLFPSSFLWTANLLAAWLFAACVWRAPWKRIGKPAMLHLWLACCVTLMLLWSIKTGIRPGLNFHLLGATALTLMFGPRLAIIAFTIVLGGITLTGASGWESFGLNLLMMAALPVLFSYLVYSQAHHKLPRHVFVYIFVDAFVTAGLTMCLYGFFAVAILAGAGVYPQSYLDSDYLPYFILMGWSEAILTGMAITLMVVYRPEWLTTFSDRLYVKGR